MRAKLIDDGLEQRCRGNAQVDPGRGEDQRLHPNKLPACVYGASRVAFDGRIGVEDEACRAHHSSHPARDSDGRACQEPPATQPETIATAHCSSESCGHSRGEQGGRGAEGGEVAGCDVGDRRKVDDGEVGAVDKLDVTGDAAHTCYPHVGVVA